LNERASSGSRGFTWNEARSIHLGVNRVDDAVYRGALPALSGAEEDARQMRRLADSMGFSSRLFVSEDATRENVADCLESTIERLVDGDVLLVTYSGHMTSIAGIGDDADGWDEAWCLRDGVLLDDEFHDLLSAVPSGADVIVVTDSCFAAGMVDGPSGGAVAAPGDGTRSGSDARAARLATSVVTATSPFGPRSFVASDRVISSVGGPSATARAPEARTGDLLIGQLVRAGAIPMGASRAVRRRPIGARVVALAAAAEGSLAFEGERMGFFTAALVAAVESAGDEPLSYPGLMDGVLRHLPGQRPSIGVFGAATGADAQSPAFVRSSDRPTPSDSPTKGFGQPGRKP
jgi:hypothetical protein